MTESIRSGIVRSTTIEPPDSALISTSNLVSPMTGYVFESPVSRTFSSTFSPDSKRSSPSF